MSNDYKHEKCIRCSTDLKGFQRMIGFCNWCLKAYSDANKGRETGGLDPTFDFGEGDDHTDEIHDRLKFVK